MTDAAPPIDDPRQPWRVLAAVIVGLFMVILDGTAVNVALKTLQVAFNVETHAAQSVISLYVLALGVTTPLAGFLADGETHRFVWRNAVLIGGAYSLPGVFTAAPLPGIVNGSLWTIPHEVRCYLALAVLGALGLVLSRGRFTLLLLAAMAVHLLVPEHAVPLLYDARRLAFAFFLGVLAWLWRDRLPLSWPLAIAAAALALAVPADMVVKTAISQIGFGYLALVAAFRVPAAVRAASAWLPDYSYGIYIYAFPMQQVALALGAREPLANIALAFALTVPLAALSWHLVEKPALALKPAGRA